MNILSDTSADIMLSDLVDMSAYIKPLSENNLFKNVYQLTDREFVRGFNQFSYEKKCAMYKKPKKHMVHVKIDKVYTDFYCFYVDPYLKMLYYSLIHDGTNPLIHLVEDGLASYVVDFTASSDVATNKYYGKKKAFTNNIAEMFLYEPDFFSMERTFPINNLPKIGVGVSELKSAYKAVFGFLHLPKEKFIFFEEAFLDNFRLASDLNMMREFANKVGKKNIIVKPHPRNKPDRWIRHEFEVMPFSNIPWEIAILLNDIQDKVFLTAASAAAINSYIVFDIAIPAFLLYKVLTIGECVHARQREFKTFIHLVQEKFNAEKPSIFVPKNYDVFKTQLEYTLGVRYE